MILVIPWLTNANTFIVYLSMKIVILYPLAKTTHEDSLRFDGINNGEENNHPICIMIKLCNSKSPLKKIRFEAFLLIWNLYKTLILLTIYLITFFQKNVIQQTNENYKLLHQP